ncbi:hypothetical protein DFH09DRAFT_1091804 [Mycena vulgaris]|nr:hypothetical protein DFH09DRAFT_1091804 [Mycena vulgaris]
MKITFWLSRAVIIHSFAHPTCGQVSPRRPTTPRTPAGPCTPTWFAPASNDVLPPPPSPRSPRPARPALNFRVRSPRAVERAVYRGPRRRRREEQGADFRRLIRFGRREGHFTRECKEPVVCVACGQEGHQRKVCPNPDPARIEALKTNPIVCFRCGKPGHTMSACPQPAKCYTCQQPFALTGGHPAKVDNKDMLANESIINGQCYTGGCNKDGFDPGNTHECIGKNVTIPNWVSDGEYVFSFSSIGGFNSNAVPTKQLPLYHNCAKCDLASPLLFKGSPSVTLSSIRVQGCAPLEDRPANWVAPFIGGSTDNRAEPTDASIVDVNDVRDNMEFGLPDGWAVPGSCRAGYSSRRSRYSSRGACDPSVASAPATAPAVPSAPVAYNTETTTGEDEEEISVDGEESGEVTDEEDGATGDEREDGSEEDLERRHTERPSSRAWGTSRARCAGFTTEREG